MDRRRENLCEDDISKDQVDGRVEGRTGVQVESEVGAQLSRKQQRGRVRHAVLDVKNDCFVRHYES